MDPDLSSLQLNGTSQTVLGHLLADGDMSVGALAAVAGTAPSVVSRALRSLEQRGLVQMRSGRAAPAALAPRAGAVLRAEAMQLREVAGRRAADLERLAGVVEELAPARVDPLPLYWLVPVSAEGPDLESAVRRVRRSVDVCVPRGRRARGIPPRVSPAPPDQVSWRMLVSTPGQAPEWVPPRVRLVVRRIEVDLPFLEVLDGAMFCAGAVVDGFPRRVWCRQPAQVALASAGFEHWWERGEPVLRE